MCASVASDISNSCGPFFTKHENNDKTENNNQSPPSRMLLSLDSMKPRVDPNDLHFFFFSTKTHCATAKTMRSISSLGQLSQSGHWSKRKNAPTPFQSILLTVIMSLAMTLLLSTLGPPRFRTIWENVRSFTRSLRFFFFLKWRSARAR